jgi:hypothetical protein
LRVNGGVHATGKGADAVVVEGGTVPLTNLEVSAKSGAAIRLKGASVTAMLALSLYMGKKTDRVSGCKKSSGDLVVGGSGSFLLISRTRSGGQGGQRTLAGLCPYAWCRFATAGRRERAQSRGVDRA